MNKWDIKVYYGHSDYEIGDPWKINKEMMFDEMFDKNDIENMLLYKFKKHRCVTIMIKQQ